MTDNLTNFGDLSDVTDAAIEYVLSHSPNQRDYQTVSRVREFSDEGYPEDRAIILAARLIQQHRPDLLVDPAEAIVREELAKEYEGAGMLDIAVAVRRGKGMYNAVAAAKRLYLMGIEKGKGA